MSENEARLNRSILVILAEGFLSRLSFGIISFTLPLFAYRKLGLSLTETGFLFSLNLISEQAFKPLMGVVADRFGLKRSFTIAIGIRSLVALLLSFAVAPWQVFFIRAIHGFSESLRDPSVSALIAENARKKSLGSAYAWYTTAKMTAGSIGKAAGGVLLGLTLDNYSRVFLVAFALSALPLFVVFRYLREPERGKHEEPQATQENDGQKVDKTDPGARPGDILQIAGLGFLLAGSANMIANLFPLLAMEYGGLSAAQTGLIYTISIVVVIAAGPGFGWLSDHVSHKLVLLVRGLTNTSSSIMFYFFPNFVGMMTGNILDSAGKAAFRPAWGALMAQVSSLDRRRRARTMSYLSLGEGLGETVGPLLGGFLWNTWGVGVMLATRVAVALIGEIYTGKVIRSQGIGKKR